MEEVIVNEVAEDGIVEPIGYIYKLTAPNGKAYVGQTTRTVRKRWLEHVSNAKSVTEGVRVALYEAIRELGAENFTVETLYECEPGDDMDLFEDEFIESCGTLMPNGYNMRRGGKDGKYSDELLQRNRADKIETKTRRVPEEKLPTYVRYHKETNKYGTVLEGYRVEYHPNGSNKSFIDSSKTLEERLQAAIAYKEELDAATEYVDNTKKTPKHIVKYKGGYAVRKPGFASKFFDSGNPDDDLAEAIEHLTTLDAPDYVPAARELPKGINKCGERGFDVKKPGFPVKRFGKGTRDENLAAAIAHLASLETPEGAAVAQTKLPKYIRKGRKLSFVVCVPGKPAREFGAGTRDENLAAAIAHKALITSPDYVDAPKEKLPKGIVRCGDNGFTVRIPGTSRQFTKDTREENLRLATECLNSINAINAVIVPAPDPAIDAELVTNDN